MKPTQPTQPTQPTKAKSTDIFEFDFAKMYGEPTVITEGNHNATMTLLPNSCNSNVLMVRFTFDDGSQELQSYRKGTTASGVDYDLISQFAKNLAKQTGKSINEAIAHANSNPIKVNVKITDTGLVNIMPKATTNDTTDTPVEVDLAELNDKF